ncbi:uncharacterized protein LOC109513741 [Hippocampus comes]|uniref:uncharacterized protein LOC109513741 n=1 Tax=Hippocampus comes TaxID=109280 RepID=UPI00094E2403|nr:PREDICTED: uncharacterized protein LOC109513741 [Hippocampus comes]
MNGAVYIPFFQGQLESVLEQVVQLAVHEISSTVGSSLNALLLEAAAQEQENRRLRLRLQAWESHHGHNKGGAEEYRESQAAAAGDDGSDGVRKKPEQPAKPRGPTDSRRLEQRGRVVEQLKSVMERVLHSALCQLKKMVEASFDDLLLEITQKECERQTLQARLDCKRGAARREARDNPGSPGGSEAAPKDTCPEPAEETGGTGGTEDKANAVVFGHEWCGDIWKPKGSVGGGGASGRGSSEGPDPPLLPAMALTLESPRLQDPRWTPLEDMDVLCPDRDAAPAPAPPPLTPSGSWGIHSSASMLQRLLTASQLPDDNAGTTHKKPQDARVMPTGQGTKQQQEEEEQEEEEEEDKHDQGEEEEEEEEKGRKKKRRKVWSECEDCGRRFSRVLLLKAHRQIHADANVGVTSSRCSLCGKRFPSAGRLRSHLQAKHRS